MDLITSFYEYLNAEVSSIEHVNERKPFWFDLKESKEMCISRAYGVQLFLQNIGCSYDDIIIPWELFKEELRKIE